MDEHQLIQQSPSDDDKSECVNQINKPASVELSEPHSASLVKPNSNNANNEQYNVEEFLPILPKTMSENNPEKVGKKKKARQHTKKSESKQNSKKKKKKKKKKTGMENSDPNDTNTGQQKTQLDDVDDEEMLRSYAVTSIKTNEIKRKMISKLVGAVCIIMFATCFAIVIISLRVSSKIDELVRRNGNMNHFKFMPDQSTVFQFGNYSSINSTTNQVTGV
ncbi:hypothetical protein SNEBB_009467 [Seison nebaliae]|nr:hypothetical protein SNEBB_009467 [Seison nebaliae]